MLSIRTMREHIDEIKKNFNDHPEIKEKKLGSFVVKKWPSIAALLSSQNKLLEAKKSMRSSLYDLYTELNTANNQLDVKQVHVVDDNRFYENNDDTIFLTVANTRELSLFKKDLNQNNQMLNQAAEIVMTKYELSMLNSSIEKYNVLVYFAVKSITKCIPAYTRYGTFDLREDPRDLLDACNNQRNRRSLG